MSSTTDKQYKQAIEALRACQRVLSDIACIARMYEEQDADAMKLYLDEDGVIPEVRCAMLNAQLVLDLYDQRRESSRVVSNWAAETMGLTLLAGRAD